MSRTGPGISFDAKGQNDKLKNSGIQNRGGKLVTVAPKGATNAKAEWPMTGLRQARAKLSFRAGRSPEPGTITTGLRLSTIARRGYGFGLTPRRARNDPV